MTSLGLAFAMAEQLRETPSRLTRIESYGTVVRSVGLLIEAKGVQCGTGDICQVQVSSSSATIPAEVVGFDEQVSYLMPLTATQGIQPGTRISHGVQQSAALPDLDSLLGRVVNGLCEPIDGEVRGLSGSQQRVVENINPMLRPPISEPLDTGIGSINSLLTVGQGQRLGLFAGSGVGKSVLLGMLARFVHADVVVVGLIGERGREVREFVRDNLGEGLQKSVVVACPADDSAALRIRGVRLATEIAERFRAQGKRVLLLVDSLTRVAQAQREIGLAMGEPPSAKGYTPSSFALLPKLVERAGLDETNGGSITAFYTVLAEEDDLQDPIVDAARAILDGHMVLNRRFTEQGIFPAIDIGASISRVMNKIVSKEDQDLAAEFRRLWQKYQNQEDLISIGAYRPGSEPDLDRAIALYPRMCQFLRQAEDEKVDAAQARSELISLFSDVPVEVA